MMTQEKFRKMCMSHDLTYEYSDDARYWRAGCKSLTAIQVAAKDLPREDAVRIWNEVVDLKIKAGYGENFKWK